ncbi:MAG: MaoC family dehydratase [Thermoleophilaceae bacterium]
MTYDELDSGFHFAGAPLTVTDAHVVLLGGLIGNLHPSHLSDEYSTRVGPFKRRVAHGELVHALMVTGFADVLRATSQGQLGGSYTLEAPVFVGDTIYTEITLETKRLTKSDKRGFARFAMGTFNQDGVRVAHGTADFLVAREPLEIYSPATPAGGAHGSTDGAAATPKRRAVS